MMQSRKWFKALLLLIVLALSASLVVACGPNPEQLAEEGDVEGLIEALDSNDVVTRQDAAMALAEVGDERAVPALIEALEDEDEFVRALAANALGEIGDERAVEPLRDALDDDSETVQSAAQSALNQLDAD